MSVFDEQPTKKLVKQEKRAFESVSSEAFSLEINELDLLDQIQQLKNSMIDVKNIDEPKIVTTKKSPISEFTQEKAEMKKNATADFKSGQEFLKNINSSHIEEISSDDEKESKFKFRNNNTRNSLGKKSERKNSLLNLSDIHNDPFFTKACKKVCSKVQEEVQKSVCEEQKNACKNVTSNFQIELPHKIKDVQPKRKDRYNKEEEFKAITRLIFENYPSANFHFNTRERNSLITKNSSR